MGFFSDLFSSAVAAIGTLITTGVRVAAQIVEAVKKEYEEVRKANSKLALEDRKKRAFGDINEVNSLILELEQKRRRDTRLSASDEADLSRLKQRRETLRGQVQEASEKIIIEDIAEKSGDYKSVVISDENTHILQFHVGQAVYGKTCSRCSKPMTLQWRLGIYSVSMNDFFWGCTGFFDNTCRITEKFKEQDLSLFTNTKRDEFNCSTQELNSIILIPNAAKSVEKRMDEVRNVATDVYLCPVHHEPMILREKKDAKGLLDQYFFSCPRWQAQACSQLVKLKSAAQLASALEAFTGRGIL
jgi:hypothetical protein